MDSITIAGIPLRMASFAERAREYRGEAVRAFDNSLLDGTDQGKRAWDGQTMELLPADEQALRAAIAFGTVACTGLALYGETVYCKVTVESAVRGPDTVSANHTDFSAVAVTLSLTLREA
jgi:hypothetical protein